MTVVFDRPYQFVPPHRGNLWPALVQRFRIVDWYLRKKEGVVDYECRGLEHLKGSLEQRDGILLAPNHCRYADPLVLGWPARQLRTHLFAMASWHLFNAGGFDAFAIQKMGGFSINREAADRQSLETAIEILVNAERPLVLFPEGTTNRTNDVLKPLLEGVTFIARSAARRRKKTDGGQVVMHPIGIKYLCNSDFRPWADEQLQRIETRLGWQKPLDQSILERTVRLAEGLLALKEVQYLGKTKCGELPPRRDNLIRHLLEQSETHLGIDQETNDIRPRVRSIRSDALSMFFSSNCDATERQRLRRDVDAAELAQELLSYPDCYLLPQEATDTRIVETIQRMQETLFGIADASIPLRAVIQIDQAIVVPTEKAPRGKPDPLMLQLQDRLTTLITSLSKEARPLADL